MKTKHKQIVSSPPRSFARWLSPQPSPAPPTRLPSWNDGKAKQSIIDFVDEGDEARLAGFRAGAGTHRRV